MAPVRNGRVLFNEIPTGYPEPGKTVVYDDSQTIDLEQVPLNGGTLLKTLILSIDPYMRNQMRSAYQKGQPLFNYGVGIVLQTENPAVQIGDHVYGVIPFQEYSIFPDISTIPKFYILKNEEKLPLSVYVGALGSQGKTAYMGWKEYAHPQKGDIVFISAGAGGVGSFVLQTAKKEGLKVIASAGSDDKVQFMKELGADVVFNYKTTDVNEVLEKEGPINIYWDNVGGKTLDAAIGNAARGARFIECGMITEYNDNPQQMVNLMHIVRSEIRLRGFVISNLLPKYSDAFYAEVPGMIARGEIKYREDAKLGLERVGEAVLDVQTGKNNGKSIVIVSKDV